MLAFNNDLYLGLVFIHVFAAMVWVGGAFVFQVRIAQLRKANDMVGFLQVGVTPSSSGSACSCLPQSACCWRGSPWSGTGLTPSSCGSCWR